jgi:hypothetical protein
LARAAQALVQVGQLTGQRGELPGDRPGAGYHPLAVAHAASQIGHPPGPGADLLAQLHGRSHRDRGAGHQHHHQRPQVVGRQEHRGRGDGHAHDGGQQGRKGHDEGLGTHGEAPEVVEHERPDQGGGQRPQAGQSDQHDGVAALRAQGQGNGGGAGQAEAGDTGADPGWPAHGSNR